MQRQSLGSPSSNLHGHGRGGVAMESAASASPSPSSPSSTPVIAGAVDEDDVKLEKLHRRRSLSPLILRAGTEKFIHLIPILVLLCFLVLFLYSHEPSPTDSREMDEFDRVMDKGEILAIRSLRNLQEIRKDSNKKSSSHRKLADF